MGTSRSGSELAGKLTKLAGELADNRRAITAAAFAAKQAFTAAEPGVVGHRLAGGKVGVGFNVKGQKNATAIVRFTGPAHLALNPTKGHRIEPRRRRRGGRRRALTVGDGFAAHVSHPGTSGKDPGAARAKAAAAVLAPKAYFEWGVVRPMRGIF